VLGQQVELHSIRLRVMTRLLAGLAANHFADAGIMVRMWNAQQGQAQQFHQAIRHHGRFMAGLISQALVQQVAFALGSGQVGLTPSPPPAPFRSKPRPASRALRCVRTCGLSQGPPNLTMIPTPTPPSPARRPKGGDPAARWTFFGPHTPNSVARAGERAVDGRARADLERRIAAARECQAKPSRSTCQDCGEAMEGVRKF